MRFILFILLLVLLFGFMLSGSEYSPGSEIGNAVFRPLRLWDVLDLVEHTADFRNSDGRKDWDAQSSMINSSWDYSVIQVAGRQLQHQEISPSMQYKLNI